MALAVRFDVMVELIALRGKMTYVARGNDDVLSGKKHVVLFPSRTLAFPPSNACHFALQCNQFNRENERGN